MLFLLRKKTIPHTFTFLVWSIASSITWALQVYGGAGVGASITFVVTSACIFIFLLSLKYGEKHIVALDIVLCLELAGKQFVKIPKSHREAFLEAHGNNFFHVCFRRKGQSGDNPCRLAFFLEFNVPVCRWE